MNSDAANLPLIDAPRALNLAREALDIEAAALHAMSERLDGAFTAVVQRILQLPGRVVVMGMGKSGHVGRKVAATLASTGTPAFFVHPAEASHGDLGMLTQDDLVLALSNSGETDELTGVLPAIKRRGVPLVAVTGGLNSTLAKHADWVLDTRVDKEACPLNLAPTASTTAQLAMGDALAVALLDARGFGAEDFARSHPGGALGRRLLTHVRDVMRRGADVPQVAEDVGSVELMREMSAKGLGCSAVVNACGELVGIFTDGDLRRCVEAGVDLRSRRARDVMHARPLTIKPDLLAVAAARMMEEHGITAVLVTDDGRRLQGVVHIRDLMRAKVI
ncbi:MAG: KpsF/GutQ family sugar-phosphate isomerase [Comamonas sp.]|jgi:arabinose-5-phosphate isomerase|uniref:KpsF/GutQ family sugar-phosphate isomerase n=1 Tax=Comamonas sp. TaxID=34028 RepID=UPI00283DC23C|nr:KpsF/GutQ family sugar-phosphate isomerase [Comamonas sp.]MDR3067213.1 KpsF/GutQ family sugar-phosphate isomerase [Comamonas sp.]